MRQKWIIGYTERMEEGRSGKKIYCPDDLYREGCNTDVFNAWTEQVVLAKLPSGARVVMDHAGLGKRSAKTKEFIESTGYHWRYLPTYALWISILLGIAGIPLKVGLEHKRGSNEIFFLLVMPSMSYFI